MNEVIICYICSQLLRKPGIFIKPRILIPSDAAFCPGAPNKISRQLSFCHN